MTKSDGKKFFLRGMTVEGRIQVIYVPMILSFNSNIKGCKVTLRDSEIPGKTGKVLYFLEDFEDLTPCGVLDVFGS